MRLRSYQSSRARLQAKSAKRSYSATLPVTPQNALCAAGPEPACMAQVCNYAFCSTLKRECTTSGRSSAGIAWNIACCRQLETLTFWMCFSGPQGQQALADTCSTPPSSTDSKEQPRAGKEAEGTYAGALRLLMDDMNTPAALSTLSAPLKSINDLQTTKAGKKNPNRWLPSLIACRHRCCLLPLPGKVCVRPCRCCNTACLYRGCAVGMLGPCAEDRVGQLARMFAVVFRAG